MTPLSAFIIARDEADRIARAVESVREVAAEVIVVDSGSTDDTVAIARTAGARVIHNDWPGYGAQKRFAEAQCAHDWLVNLDADEALTPALAAEIAALMATGPGAPCWTVAIRDVFAHERAPAPHAWGYRQIRLYDRRVARFSASPVHDTVRPPPGTEIRALRAPMEHRSLRSLAFAAEKMNRYSDAQVEEMRGRGRRMPRWRLLTEFPLSFLKSWLLRRNILYGWWGFVLAMNYAWSRFLRVAKAVEADLLDGGKRG